METLNRKTASRFNRTTPMFSTDKMVADAVTKLAEKDEVKKAADELNAKKIKLTDIGYVRTELQKRYSYTNNQKLMLVNKTIFNALLSQTLKDGRLDLDDFDYIDVNLKAKAVDYNEQLIKYYADLVMIAKGKTIKERLPVTIDQLEKIIKGLLQEKDDLTRTLGDERLKFEDEKTALNKTIGENRIVCMNEKTALIKIIEDNKTICSNEKENLNIQITAFQEKLKAHQEKWRRVVEILHSNQKAETKIATLQKLMSEDSEQKTK